MKRVFWFLVLAALIFLSAWFYFKIIRLQLWDGRRRLNLAVQAKQVFILSLVPQEKKLIVFLIPDRTYLETADGFGFYRVESIFDLGELEGRGGEFLQESLQTYFALPIDGFLVMENLEKIDKKSILAEILKGSKSNLNQWDLIRFWWQTRQIRTDKILLIDLGQTQASETVALVDGSQALKLDSQQVDRLMDQFFKDQAVLDEDLTVAVLNATDQPGLAGQAARLITNMGGQVIEVGTWSNQVNKDCEIRGGQNSYTAVKLMQIWQCQFGGEDKAGHRADLMVILGDNFSK